MSEKAVIVGAWLPRAIGKLLSKGRMRPTQVCASGGGVDREKLHLGVASHSAPIRASQRAPACDVSNDCHYVERAVA